MNEKKLEKIKEMEEREQNRKQLIKHKTKIYK